MKALAIDVERNLRSPLVGIERKATRLGLPATEILVGVRTADTPPAERARIATRPPDILITSPESLFLLLTSKARESLWGIDTVIIDQVHAVAGTKRGAHLAFSLDRLDMLLDRPAQRIGLSATVSPVADVAGFIRSQRPATVVAEHIDGGFAAVYRVLSAYEDAGRCRRTYAVEGLGAAQFALPVAVDQLRNTAQHERELQVVILGATDPACAYGQQCRGQRFLER